MAAKFNKDALLKQRFWIIIGIAFVLGLGGVFYLGLIVHADTTKLQALAAQGKSYIPKSNQDTVNQSEKNAQVAKASEAGIWKDAWDKQENLYLWAKNVEDQFNFHNGFFVTEVKVDKLPPDPKDWPNSETPNTLSGQLIEFQPEWFKVKTREGKAVKFHKSEGINGNITVVGEDRKLNFPELRAHADKKDKLVTVQYLHGKYFMDPLTMPEQATFFESYKRQVLDILKSVDPLDAKGNGVVQLKQWLFRDELPEDAGGTPMGGGIAMPAGGGAGAGRQGGMNFIRYVSKPWAATGFKSHSEEVWIAQENLWIQKEIYRIIRDANDSISVFAFEGKAVEKPGEVASFKNSSFEAQLTLDAKNNLNFRVKNRLARNQKLDLLFRVKTNKGLQPEIIKISGPMLTPAGTKSDSYSQDVTESADSPRKGIYSVEQVLTWETAAVKRIDYISIGSADGSEYSHSHRTFDKLRPLNESAIPKAVESSKDDPMRIGMPVVGAGGDGGKGGGNKVMLEHDLWNFRYSDVTEQSRRIPVAIVLIVDQDHVDRVLAAFNNSKLRFLQSQVLLNHYTGSLQPPPTEDSLKEGGTPGTANPMPVFQPMPMRGGGQPGVIPGGGMNPLETVSDDLETNMELVIYGTMTLYQRYPPRSAAPAPKN